jgi:hypothetical protein
MKCKCCGREFQAQRSTAQFCSARCRLKNHRPNWVGRYNDVVRAHNNNCDMIDYLNNVIALLLSIAGEPNKAKRTSRLDSITAMLVASGWYEQRLKKVAADREASREAAQKSSIPEST